MLNEFNSNSRYCPEIYIAILLLVEIFADLNMVDTNCIFLKFFRYMRGVFSDSILKSMLLDVRIKRTDGLYT